MKRLFVVCLAGVLGCHRAPQPNTPTPPPHFSTVPGASPAALVAALPAHPVAHNPGEPEGEHEEIMDPVHDLSPYPDTAAGAEAMVRALAHEAIRHDAEGLVRARQHLDADSTHLELALTFDGARALGLRTLAGIPAARGAILDRLAVLHEPLQITVTSALGSELTDTDARGMDPRFARLHTLLRPGVRFYRVDAVGAGSVDHVVIEPLAYLAGQWTYLGQPWAASAGYPTVPGTLPSGPAH